MQPASELNNSLTSYETEVFHYVDPGETLEEIAQRYGRTVEEIAQWNGLYPPYKLEAHQKLLVSGPPSGQAIISDEPISRQPIYSRRPAKQSPKKTSYQSPVVKSCTGKAYIVQPGDTLYQIAKRCKKNDRDIVRWNHLSPPYTLSVGSKIWLSSPSKKVAVNSSSSQSSLLQEKYTVQPGDTLYSVAKRSGRSISEIKAWNNLSSVELPLGKVLVLKSSSRFSTEEPQALQSTPFNKRYIVQPGDTLYSVAKRTGYSMKDIMAWNTLSSPHLPVGQKLIFASSSLAKNSSSCHKVMQGETLFSIAKSYGYQVKEIARWNNLSPPYTLERGQSLRVSPQIKSCW